MPRRPRSHDAPLVRRQPHSARSAPRVLRDAATPYGFTVALWLSSSLLSRAHGRPGVIEILLFATGALTGFAGVGELAGRLTGPEPAAGAWSLVQALHVGPVLAVLAGIAMDDLVLGGVAAWLVGGVIVAVGYFGGVSVESRYVAARHRP